MKNSLGHWARMLPVLLIGACDLPTALPDWETSWSVPGKSATVTVASFLPDGITLTDDSAAFLVAVDSMQMPTSLGQICPACVAISGLVVPKPAFTLLRADSVTLLSDVRSATLTSDTLLLVITNGLPFDVLRPSTDPTMPTGKLNVRVSNGAAVLATTTANGRSRAMPGFGAVTTLRIPLMGAVDGTRPVVLTMRLDSPAGDPVVIDPAAALTVTAMVSSGAVGQLRIASPAVTLVNQAIEAAPTIVDLSSVDSNVTSRVLGGRLQLTMNNPFGIQGTAQAVFRTAAGTVVKEFSVSDQSSSALAVDLTTREIQKLIGREVEVTLRGTACPTPCTVPLDPTRTGAISSRLELTLSSDEHP